MDVTKKNLLHLKMTLVLLTSILVVAQFYLLSLKLPFEVAFSQKSVGFFAIFLNKLNQSSALWLPLLFFIGVQIALQSFLTILIYYFTKYVNELLPSLRPNIYLWGILIWLGCQALIFLWNGYLFPYSFFAIKFAWLHSYSILFYLLIAITAIAIIFFTIILVRALARKWLTFVLACALLLLIFTSHYFYVHFKSTRHFSSKSSPNVIIVIADSLRPEFAMEKSTLPSNPLHLDDMVRGSAFFKNTFTVLGRSTPGLISILTGNYPKTHGGRYNLVPTKFIHLENSLTTILKSRGYQTIFLADGLQFMNLDQNYGFDQVITPQSGIYDYIFSFINDTPLSNLLINTRMGAWLFPYNYANRSAYYSYLPESFVHLVDDRLVNLQPAKPALLVSILAVAHWPYVWGQQPQEKTIEERYEDSALELDKQFAQLMQVFKQRGLLENTILVILSDHGDSLGLPGDRIIQTQNYIGPERFLALIPKRPYTTKRANNQSLLGIDTASGHGTDLLSMTQLNTTLAFHYPNVIKPQVISDRVALIDVTPTLLDLLNIKVPFHFDGVSLKPLMFGQTNPAINRPIFLETDIDIPLIDVTKVNEHHGAVASLIEQYSDLYDIDLKSQQLVLKDTAVAHLLHEKQLGIIDGDWLLAYFPGKNSLDTTILLPNAPEIKNCYYTAPARTLNDKVTETFCYQLHPTIPYFVLVNLKTLKWQILFAGDGNPVFVELLKKLQSFYAGELLF